MKKSIRLIKNKSAACGVEIDKGRQTGGNGKHTNPTTGPAPCGEYFWVCEKVIVTEKKHEDDCKPKCIEDYPDMCSTFGKDSGWCICP